MVRHSVFFWLDDSVTDEQKQSFEAGLQALGDIDVVNSVNFGKAAGTPERPVTQNTYDYSLFLEFDDVEKHNAYQVHEGHTVFVDSFSQWFKEVKVYDTQF